MSQFNPTYSTFDPSARPDHLSSALIHSLSRRALGLTWGPAKTFFLAGITFGILPLVVWPRKFRKFAAFEQRQLWHLVEWLRIRGGDDEVKGLENSVRVTGPMPTLWLVPLTMLGILAAIFFGWLNTPHFNFPSLLDNTYIFDGTRSRMIPIGPWSRHFRPWSMQFHVIWTLCLSVAYASHWLHVQQHAADVHRVVRRMNVIFAKRNIPPVGFVGPGIGLRPLWILAALIGVSFGAWWAIPAALAGAVHQRYIERASMRVRGELSDRVALLLKNQRPFVDVPTPHGSRIICRNRLCEKSVPAGATYCPRCGTRIASIYDAVA